MIVHVFNSSVVSGPETLVIPALPGLGEPVAVVFLSETRTGDRSKGPPAYSRSFGLQTSEVVVRSRWDRRAVRELAQVLKSLNPRIVHAHEVKASAYVAAASRGQPWKLVTTNHGVRAKKAPTLRFYEWLYTHMIMRRFDRVLCVCSSDRELLISRGVPAKKVFTHLNGVDRAPVDPARRAEESARIRQEWGLPARGIAPEAKILGLVGRLAPEKRHLYIIRALTHLRERNPKLDVHLVIFGIGALGEWLKAETRALELEDRVHWMGYRGTVGTENAGFDLLVSLSFAEGLPINVVEAGWASTPVLLTAVDGNLDLVPTEEYGLRVDVKATEAEVAEILDRALASFDELQRKGGALQRRVREKFSGEAWITRLREIYTF